MIVGFVEDSASFYLRTSDVLRAVEVFDFGRHRVGEVRMSQLFDGKALEAWWLVDVLLQRGLEGVGLPSAVAHPRGLYLKKVH